MFRKKDVGGLVMLNKLIVSAFDVYGSEWQPISEYVTGSIAVLVGGDELLVTVNNGGKRC